MPSRMVAAREVVHLHQVDAEGQGGQDCCSRAFGPVATEKECSRDLETQPRQACNYAGDNDSSA